MEAGGEALPQFLDQWKLVHTWFALHAYQWFFTLLAIFDCLPSLFATLFLNSLPIDNAWALNGHDYVVCIDVISGGALAENDSRGVVGWDVPVPVFGHVLRRVAHAHQQRRVPTVQLIKHITSVSSPTRFYFNFSFYIITSGVPECVFSLVRVPPNGTKTL